MLLLNPIPASTSFTWFFYALVDSGEYLGKNFLELCDDLFSEVANDFSSFDCSLHQIQSCSLDKHAPLKMKLLWANHAPYMTKALRNAIMKTSSLNNKTYKNGTVEN